MRLPRIRLSIAGLMILVAVVALVFSRFRAIGPDEAIRRAMAYEGHQGCTRERCRPAAFAAEGYKMWIVTFAPVDDADHMYVLVHFDGRCVPFVGRCEGVLDPVTGKTVGWKYSHPTAAGDTDWLFLNAEPAR